MTSPKGASVRGTMRELIGAVTAVAGIAAAGTAIAASGPAEEDLPGSPNVCLKGTGSPRWCGDHDRASKAKVSGPVDVAPLPGGGYLIADTGNHVIRRVDRRRGVSVINTVAGYGIAGRAGDGRAAIDARLDTPTGVAALKRGGFLIADLGNHVVRRVYRRGVIRTVAGNGRFGSAGDDAPATEAQLMTPADVAELPRGGFLVADPAARRVRRIDKRGVITTVAGSGQLPSASNTGDGGPATAASLGWPVAVAPEPDGGFLVADAQFDAVRRVDPAGMITTVAGGDGLVAGVALREPLGVAPTGDGGFVVSDAGVIHRVFADGSSPKVVAGTGTKALDRERGAATAVSLDDPAGIAWLGSGIALIADRDNDRIRRLSGNQIGTLVGLDRRDPAEPPPPGAPPVPLRPCPNCLIALPSPPPKAKKCTRRANGAKVDFGILRFVPRKAGPGKRKVRVRVYSTNKKKARFTATVRRKGKNRAKGSARFRYGKHNISLDRRLKADKYRVKVTLRIEYRGTRTSCISRTVTLVLAK